MKKVILGLGLVAALGFIVAAALFQHKKMFERQARIEVRLGELEKEIKSMKVSVKRMASRRENAQKEDYSKAYDIDISDSHILGRKDAPVTIVEFVDFQCPYCARFHPLVLEAVKAYPGKVRAVVKNFPLPFHKEALPAAKAAFAAGEQGKYWEMADSLLRNNGSLGEKKFKELAKALGLNVSRFLQDYKEKDSQWQGYIQKDISIGNKVEVRGTPTIYINGRKTRARDIESFRKEIDGILNAANL